MEIRVSGFGGQGIIMIGMVLGKAAALYDNKHATLTQSFGPEARGGACSAQLVISETKVLYPYLTAPDILVAMSQEAYHKFESTLKEDGFLIIEEDLVRPHPPRGRIRQFAVPATRVAEQMGSRLFANMVMLGFICAVTGVVPIAAVRQALPGSVPDRFLEQNLKALDKGYELGLQKLAT
ncbi:MAG: 2-oxoacid:acceptor oxidoreductase family protein [candidate division WOR-3 bacterium]